MDFMDLSEKMEIKLKKIPTLWNAQEAVLMLSNESYPKWKQTEWLDFYFQYLCEKYLPRIVPTHKDICGTTFFDGIHDLSPDFSVKNIKGNQEKTNSQESIPNNASEEFNHVLNNYLHWRQMEWVEAYFNYLCEKMLSGFLKMPETVLAQDQFPFFMNIPLIFKSYIQNTGNEKIILSDASLITNTLTKTNVMGVIIASGTVSYLSKDDERKKEYHHLSVKNRKKVEALENELRQHSIFKLQKIHFLPISHDFFETCETFRPTDIHAEKSSLREKIVIEIPKIKEKIQYSIDFSS